MGKHQLADQRLLRVDGALGGFGDPLTERGQRRKCTPVSTPRQRSRPSATVSSAALPARSPRPRIVVFTLVAPALTAASVLAVAIPRSLWACISISPDQTSRRAEICAAVVKGSSRPTVSA
jgi:hypothetical protein